MPQPLSRVNPHAGVHIGNNVDSPSDHRPQLALLAMKVIAEWSILDSFFSGLFVKMLGANPAPGVAMYSSLSGGNAKRSAFGAVAETTLSTDELEIFNAILWLYSSARKERNKVSHWVWGYSDQLPDAVLLCDPNVLMKFNVKMEEHLATFQAAGVRTPPTLPLDEIFVFVAQDFASMSEKIQRLMYLVMTFRFLLMRDHPANQGDRQLAVLLQEPEIREYVDRQRQRQRNNPEAPVP